MSETTQRIDALSPQKKRALLLRLLKEKDRSGSVPPLRPRRQTTDRLPLSFAQQRLWFLDQFEPGNPVYNEPKVFRLKGSLNVVALQKSLSEIVRRHEILRTTFVIVKGQPTQIIAPALTLPFPVVDLSGLSEAKREALALRFITDHAQWPFDLARGPLVRPILLKLRASEYVMGITIHHIVFDGWSMGVILQEFMALYQAFSAGKPLSLPDLPIQYADFTI